MVRVKTIFLTSFMLAFYLQQAHLNNLEHHRKSGSTQKAKLVCRVKTHRMIHFKCLCYFVAHALKPVKTIMFANKSLYYTRSTNKKCITEKYEPTELHLLYSSSKHFIDSLWG